MKTMRSFLLILMISYESQFIAYKLWLDEDARADSILATSVEDQFAAQIVHLDRSHQMWSYERPSHSTYLAAVRQDQLLRQGDYSGFLQSDVYSSASA
jgi:hypothetical protein